MIRAKAVISIASRGRVRNANVYQIEDFYVDASMDTDSDQWQFTVGDLENDLADSLARDNEVRCNLFTVSQSSLTQLHTGFADEIYLSDDGKLVFNGRDITAVAVDSQLEPHQWQNINPSYLIENQARQLKIGDRLKIDFNTKMFKFLSTDGSETYWEFWYRLMRKRQRWMWADRDGTIYGTTLNYNTGNPAYHFGHPSGTVSGRAAGWIPVESMEWRKSTNERVSEVFVFGHDGKIGLVSRPTRDDTIQHWIKKPVRILSDSTVRNQGEADESAAEELFESKVGAIELKLTIVDPGTIVMQNRMAQVSIPEMGINDTFYVVGVRCVGSSNGGLIQEVRLREPHFAISKRIPRDPSMPETTPTVGGRTGGGITLPVPGKTAWGTYFADAAYKEHGPWDFVLFCAVLMAICDVESSFRNVRQGGNTEWYLPPFNDPGGVKLQKHHELFANYAENPLNPLHPQESGVGPMQLTTRSFKVEADKLGDRRTVDEYFGDRWDPQANILEAAKVLRRKLQETGAERDPVDANIWIGVKAYNGSGPKAEAYMNKVKALVDSTYLDQVQEAFKQAKTQSKGTGPKENTLIYPLGRFHDGYPNFPMGGLAVHEAKNTQSSGYYNWQSRNAVDMGVPVGTEVYAITAGVISKMYGFGSSSNIIGHEMDPDAKDVSEDLKGLRLHIESVGGNVFYYQHLHQIVVRRGQQVKAGQLLGYSGFANAAHLHFAAQYGNPETIIKSCLFVPPIPGAH